MLVSASSIERFQVGRSEMSSLERIDNTCYLYELIHPFWRGPRALCVSLASSRVLPLRPRSFFGAAAKMTAVDVGTILARHGIWVLAVGAIIIDCILGHFSATRNLILEPSPLP